MLFVQVNRHVNDLFEDLRDGLNLISLLEVLSGEHLVSISIFLFLVLITSGILHTQNAALGPLQKSRRMRIFQDRSLGRTLWRPISVGVFRLR